MNDLIDFKNVLRCRRCNKVIFKANEIDENGKCKVCQKIKSTNKEKMIQKMLEQARKIIAIDKK